MFLKSKSRNLTAGKSSTGRREATAGRAAFSDSGVLSLRLVSEIIKQFFMIQICVTVNKGQGQYNYHMMH